MEHTLRCNWLKCHRELNDHAVVTTCSHVFCIDCSNRQQLSGQREGHRPMCPACGLTLTNPDDVVVTNLNPTDDYKTSILSGLSPNIIMECAGRALSFWAYQATQEIVYQEHLSKNLTEKFGSLSTQMDKVIHDANSQISELRAKLSSMAQDQDNLRRKNEEIVQAYREKSRKQLQTQELYDKLKRRSMLGQVQSAASDAVDHTIQATVMANRFVDKVGDQNMRPPVPLYPGLQSHDMRQQVPNHNGPRLSQNASNETGESPWAGINGQGRINQNQPIQTPSSHRRRVAGGNPILGPIHPQTSNLTAGTPHLSHRATPQRSPLRNLNNQSNSFAGYGMSAGLKVSNPTETADGFARPAIRSRVAQRPGSDPSTNPAFGVPANNLFASRNGYY